MLLSILLITGIVALLTGVAFWPKIQKYLESRPLKEAIETYVEGDYTKSLEKFDNLLFQEPYSAIYHWYAAKMRHYRKNYDEAANHYEHILRINHYALPIEDLPDTQKFHMTGVLETLLEMYSELRLNEKIKTTLERLVELYPEDEDYKMRLLALLIGDKEFDEKTQQLLERAISMNQRNAMAQYWLSLLYYYKGQYKEAYAVAEKTVHYDPGINDAFFFMGYYRIKENLLEEAAQFLRKALLGKEFAKSAHHYLATILSEKGLTSEALSYSKDAVQRSSSIFEEEDIELKARYFYARLLEEEGDLKTAHEQYQFIISINKEFEDAAERLQDMKFYNRANSIEYINQLKIGDLSKLVDQLVNHLGYRATKVENSDANSFNAILEKKSDPDDRTAFFFRRNIKIADVNLISLLANYMNGVRIPQGLLISTADSTPEALKFASSHKIEIKDRETLEDVASQVIKK